jgi:putative transposase
LAYVTGLVNQELLLQNEYLATENRILKARLQPGLRLSDGERATLAEIGKRLGRKGLQQVARIAKPDTILGWYRKLVAEKFDGSKQRRSPGRPRTSSEIEDLVVRFARENSGWGYDRIVGALANLGHQVSDQTVGNILHRHGIEPAPQRSKTTTWKEFIGRHMDVLAGTDFFTVEVLTWRGLVTSAVRLLEGVHAGRTALAFTRRCVAKVRFRHLRGLPVLVHGISRRAWGLPLRRADQQLALTLLVVLPSATWTASAP